MSQLLNFKAGESSTKVKYTFDEVLTIIVLKNRKMSSKAIGELIGHSEYSVTNKYTVWLKKMVAKNGDNTMAAICESFKSPALSDAEITERVEKFLETVVTSKSA